MASNESTYHELASYSSDHYETTEPNEENPRPLFSEYAFYFKYLLIFQ